MERRPEARWLVGFQEREGPTCLVASRLDRHLESAQIDWPALTGSKNDGFGCGVVHYDFVLGPNSSDSRVPKWTPGEAPASQLSHTTPGVCLHLSNSKTVRGCPGIAPGGHYSNNRGDSSSRECRYQSCPRARKRSATSPTAGAATIQRGTDGGESASAAAMRTVTAIANEMGTADLLRPTVRKAPARMTSPETNSMVETPWSPGITTRIVPATTAIPDKMKTATRRRSEMRPSQCGPLL